MMQDRARTARMLALSDSYLRDAASEACSLHSRASAAFDAGYLGLLTLLPRQRIVRAEHPSASLLREASAKLKLDPEPALSFDARRYDHDCPAACEVAALVAWAKSVRKRLA
jgi:hypothetical protein